MIGRYVLACLDMAGTTVRDDGVVEEAFTLALGAAGVTPDSAAFAAARDYVQDTMGQSKAEVFAALLGPAEAAQATAAFARAYEQLVADGRVTAITGASEVMAWLRSRGVKVCLTTGFAPTTRQALIARLGWTGTIDLALSPADCGRGRPAPDMILGAMERLGVPDPTSVVVVGDTRSDLEAGTAAGVGAVIGVLTGAHDRATLTAAPHTAVLDGITELPALLEVS